MADIEAGDCMYLAKSTVSAAKEGAVKNTQDAIVSILVSFILIPVFANVDSRVDRSVDWRDARYAGLIEEVGSSWIQFAILFTFHSSHFDHNDQHVITTGVKNVSD